MSVKPVDSIPEREVNQKLEMLKADIREIIEKRIRMAEIINSQYAASAMRDRITTAIRKTIWGYAEERNTKHVPTISKIMDCQVRRVNGVNHFYVIFDPEKWDEEWAEIMKVEGKE